MSEKQINGKRYDIGRIDARKQFHVMRRVAPALAAMGAGSATLKAAAEDAVEADLSALGPLAEVVAKMPDADVDYVLNACLGACKVWQGIAWAPLTAPNGALMFQDLTMPEMLQITVAVVMENLGSFFAAPPAPATPAAPAA